MIRTRFAPSPTGWLHIGGVRTALFSWLYAKSLNGEFYIRIDDTDTSRSTKEFCDSIIKSLNTLNIKSDKDLIYQSNRFDIYIDKIEYLLQSKEEWDALCNLIQLFEPNYRERMLAGGLQPFDDRPCIIEKKINSKSI